MTLVRLEDVCFILACRDLPDLVSFTWRSKAYLIPEMINVTDYGRPERKYPSLHGRKFNTNPKFLGMANAYFVGPIFQMFIYLISILWNTSLLSLHHFNPYSCITPATAKLKIPDTITRLAFDSLIDFQDELQNSKDVQTVKSVPAHFLMSSQNSWKMW